MLETQGPIGGCTGTLRLAAQLDWRGFLVAVSLSPAAGCSLVPVVHSPGSTASIPLSAALLRGVTHSAQKHTTSSNLKSKRVVFEDK